MSHTPGPWEVGEVRFAGRAQLVIAGARGYVCEVQTPMEQDTLDEATRDANSRLIAAAPDLLASLYHMRCCASCAEGSWFDCEGGRAALAAIDKAEPDGASGERR